MQKQYQIDAAILAGGGSTRMGTNKALLRLDLGGPTVIERVVARLREAGFAAPLLVTGRPEQYAFLGLPMVGDEIPGAGALGGILTAISHSQAGRTLVVACDMPLLNPALLRYMAAIEDDADAIVPRWRDESSKVQVEPLHAIYTTTCASAARRRIEKGVLKASNLFDDLTVRYVEEDEMRRFDLALRSFRNVNTPEEWRSLQAELARPDPL